MIKEKETQNSRVSVGNSSPSDLAAFGVDFKRIIKDPILRYAEKQSFAGVVDVSKRIVKFKVASGTKVDRGDYYEVLSMTPGSIDDKFLRAKAPVYMNHVRGTNRGSVFGYGVDEDVLWVETKISRSPEGDYLLNDLEDEIIQNVSFRAHVLDAEVLMGADKPVLFVTRWQPYEVSFINDAVGPADFTVGIGRSGDEEENIAVNSLLPEDSEVKIEGLEISRDGAGASAAASTAFDIERSRVKSINDIAGEFNLPHDIVRTALNDGESVESFQAKAMKHIASRSTPIEKPTGPIGLTNKEKKQFSVLNICRAVSEQRPVSGFEKEVCDAAAKLSDNKPRGHLVPWEVLDIARAGTAPAIPSTMLTSNAATLIAKSVESQSFIEYLYAQTFLEALGVQTITGLIGDVGIPTELSPLDVDFIEEDDDVPSTGSKTGSVDLSPKTIGARIPIGRRLQLQSSKNVEQWMRKRMADVFAIAMERTVLAGKGRLNRAKNKQIEPKGILQLVADKEIQTLKRSKENAPLSYEDLVALEQALASANINGGRFAYITSPNVAGLAKQTMKSTQAVSPFLWEGPLVGGMGTLNGYTAIASNLMPAGGTQAKPTASIIFGNFEDVIIGGWGNGLDILVNPYTDNGAVKLRMLLDIDIKFARNESFAVITDLTTISGGAPQNRGGNNNPPAA